MRLNEMIDKSKEELIGALLKIQLALFGIFFVIIIRWEGFGCVFSKNAAYFLLSVGIYVLVNIILISITALLKTNLKTLKLIELIGLIWNSVSSIFVYAALRSKFSPLCGNTYNLNLYEGIFLVGLIVLIVIVLMWGWCRVSRFFKSN